MMAVQHYEQLRNIMFDWMKYPKFYTCHLKQVFGNEYIVYFINSVTFIKNNVNLPLNMTTETFDLRQVDAANRLTEFLNEFDESFRTYVDTRLNDFPNGAAELV